MTKSNDTAGYFRSGLPYSRLGSGPRILLNFEGLGFENKPYGSWLIRIIRRKKGYDHV